jgi:hypothetical protein
MPSAYTPNLNLEKPAHGEHANDWDAVVNANFDALDAAAWRIPVRTGDPASPVDGEQWVRSDLAQWRIRIGATTYEVNLAAV